MSLNGDAIVTVIPEQESQFGQILFLKDGVLSVHREGFTSSVLRWNWAGKSARLNLPPNGTSWLLPDLGDGSSIFLGYESFVQPPAIFEYASASGTLAVWSEKQAARPAAAVEVQHTTYSSLDGAKIPITLVGHEVSCRPQSPRAAIMTGYGGFGVTMTPQYSVLVSLLLEYGAVFVIPHIRGGGEFGKLWHDAGRKAKKQTSFNDFLAAADWLCREGITSSSRLAIFGGSNSGLLVGAAMTQRPDLFRAILSTVARSTNPSYVLIAAISSKLSTSW